MNILALNSTSSSALASYALLNDFTLSRPTVIQLIVHILVFLLGVPGNCLILRVYWTKTRKTSTHVLIMALAWADLAVCLLRIPVISAIALILAGDWIPWIGRKVILILSAFGETAIVMSFLVTAIIAADRYDCVCRPQRRFFTPRRAKIAAWSAVLFAVVTDTPACLLRFTSYSLNLKFIAFAFFSVSFATALVTIVVCYGKVYATIRKHVKVGDVPNPTLMDKGRLRLGDTRSTRPMPPRAATSGESNLEFADKIVSTIINQPGASSTPHTNSQGRKSSAPSHVIPDMSPGVAGKFGLAQKAKQSSTRAEQDQRAVIVDRNPRKEQGNGSVHAPERVGGAVLQHKTTRMLFITSLVFLLTWLPFMIYLVNNVAVLGSSRDIFHNIINDLWVALLINNVVNPLIYGLANRRFRKDCREVVSRIKLCKYS